MKFSNKSFLSKCELNRRNLRICFHVLKKFLIENFMFCAVSVRRIFLKELTQIFFLWRLIMVKRSYTNYVQLAFTEYLSFYLRSDEVAETNSFIIFRNNSFLQQESIVLVTKYIPTFSHIVSSTTPTVWLSSTCN